MLSTALSLQLLEASERPLEKTALKERCDTASLEMRSFA